MGATINTMVLAGFVVALGAVVDDAIIDVENIVRRLRQHRAGGQHASRPRASSSKRRSRCARPIVHATLIIVLAVTPVFFMGGLSGAFFEPLALAYLAGDAGLDGGGADGDAGAVPAAAQPRRHRAAAVAAGAVAQASLRRDARRASSRRRARPSPPPLVIVVAAIACGRSSGASLLPAFKERDFLMHWVTRRGNLAPGDVPDHPARPAASCAPFRACATSAPTSGAPLAATNPTA